MKIVAWNCRGLGNRPAVRSLLELQKAEKADILFLSETKMKKRRLERFRWIIGLTNMMAHDGEGQGGGVAIFWRNGVRLQLESMSKYHIGMGVEEEIGSGWRFTGFYGEPRTDYRDRSWEILRNLKTTLVKPWLCAGDFNEILVNEEKVGGAPRSQGAMEKFRDALEVCGLYDLGWCGDMFTWRNHSHTVENYIKETLDRAVANEEWRRKFPVVKVINGDPRSSDHRPIIISTDREDEGIRRRHGAGGFKFEASWVKESGCRKVVEDAWKQALEEGISYVGEATKVVAGSLKSWSSNVLGDLEKRIKQVKTELERCRSSGAGERVVREEVLRYRLEKLEDQVDLFWRQRAHIRWLKEGDRNTKFFHAVCKERSRTGNLKREEGEGWVESEEEKKSLIAYW
ncbi:hypothetical protein BS78_K272300 [Paspalum vaginatum]|uniref:Endonuclease/exonuclease/phosphatase domain-containing protein n=1 Tax=Paspalum vaginatum TaxID=158149 RepID=A0A9W7XBG0_9POAL|nr:hypothetical protein BS78_K272300 [Paspalum vaginatum]